MAHDGLRIEFARSGGFAGLTLQTTLDVSELPPEEARELERLVDSLEKAEIPAQRGEPDRFQYDLTITRGDQSRHVVLGERGLTAEARELVDHLVERARARRSR
jgi:hypothetical protein